MLQRRSFPVFLCASILMLLCGLRAAHADAALLLEEPFGEFGNMNPTGHAAIYLDHVCAASLTQLRICQPGELGVVISRYHKIGGYDWLAVPLIPYLYAVDDPAEVPESITPQKELLLRDRYRRDHLLSIAPDDPKHEIPGGEWTQLIGASYDRKIYGYQIETTRAQDERFIAAFNARPNRSHFNLFFNNCANFAEMVFNFYYPHSIHRNYLADTGLMTPKQAARSLVAYSKRHPDLKFTAFVVPQVKGTTHRSDSVDGVVESLVKSKKYVLPIVAFHPFVAGGLVIAYLGDGRFHPGTDARVFEPAREFAQASLSASSIEATASTAETEMPAAEHNAGGGTN